jgi:signal transduction histidine kinase
LQPPDDTSVPQEATSGRAVAVPLTVKGLVACLVLVAYAGAMAAYVMLQRQERERDHAALDQLQAKEESLKRAALAVSNALLALRQVTLGDDPAAAAQAAAPFALEAVERALGAWRESMPTLFARHADSQRRLAILAAGATRANLLDLRESLDALGREVEGEHGRAAALHGRLALDYDKQGDRLALAALAWGLGGLVVFGGVTAWFFARLAADLRALGTRAGAIVSGYRGAPLALRRRDEVGALAADVDHLAAALAARERELALERELKAHREKMAALGAMARNVSHEIGNPLATISAIVQNAAAGGDAAANGAWQPEVLLQQVRRIAEMTRQISDFSGPRTDAPEAVDVGATVAAVSDFMRFDPRYRAARIEVAPAPALPAIMVVPDQLSEVLMNVLQMGLESGAQGAVRVDTTAVPGEVVVRISAGAFGGEPARRERTRRLVEGMGGRMTEAADAIELALPAAA